MNKIGLIGGLGPEATIIYYKLIISRYQQKLNTKDSPTLLINSINMMRIANLIANKQLADLVTFLHQEIQVLERAGMTHAAITANTPHIVFDELKNLSKIKLISIVEETCKVVKANGFDRVALFGTKATMSAGFYNTVASRLDLELVTPDETQQDFIHDKYLTELVYNVIKPETKQELIAIARKLQKQNGVEALILGGTELPLILSQHDFTDIRIFDSAAIHVDSIVNILVP